MSDAQRDLWRGQPIWLRQTPRRRYPSLVGTEQADVAIVGAGITGALVAQAFAEAGVSVAVLDGGLVGAGSTAASSALLLQEPDLGLLQLEQRYGRRRGRRVWQLSHDAVSQTVTLLRRLRVSCRLTPRDAIYYATTAASAARLRREYEERRKAGFGGRWLTPGPLRALTGIPGRGAIRSRGSVQFDPYAACVGVLRSASRAGARIFEHSAVTGIAIPPDRVRIRTRRGVVEAKRVVIATGYATPYFRPLAARFRMYRTYVLATEPLDAAVRRELGLTDVMIWDTERPYHYARWTPNHRLLLGGGDRRVRPGQRRDRQFTSAVRELSTYFEGLLPALGTIDIEASWEGLFAMTPDSLPYIGSHRRYPRHWFALGYGGNGMTFGILAARFLLERWQGVKSRDHDLFEFNR